ncbi:MAG TPA: hypothetical protein VMF06_24570, partial [Candidatus Limnocylindria bacterium]|nr:hypothetical protein [Candidatus Limnocylindria bacterium]
QGGHGSVFQLDQSGDLWRWSPLYGITNTGGVVLLEMALPQGNSTSNRGFYRVVPQWRCSP